MDNVSEFKVGDILVGFCGIHWFYRVLKVNPKSMKVILLETNKEKVEGSTALKISPKFSSPSWAMPEVAKRVRYGEQEVLFIPHSKHDILGRYESTRAYLDSNCER